MGRAKAAMRITGSMLSTLALMTLGAMALFGLGILGFVRAQRDAKAAANEASKIVEVSRNYRHKASSSSSNSSNQGGSYRCTYGLLVSGNFYPGTGCPAQGFDDSFQAQLLDGLGRTQRIQATVYFDSTDPSVNSPTEFSVLRQYDLSGGWVFIRLGIILLVFVVVGAFVLPRLNAGNTAVSAGYTTPVSFTPVPEEHNTPENQQFLNDLDRELRGALPPEQ
jgi:hypothetical protein